MSIDSDIAAIKALYANIEPACANDDAELLTRWFTDDALYMPPGNPIVAGREAIRERYRKTFQERSIDTHWEVEEVVVQVDFAYGRTTYSINVTPKAGGETTRGFGKSLDIFERQADGAWKNIRHMFSPAPAPAPENH